MRVIKPSYPYFANDLVEKYCDDTEPKLYPQLYTQYAPLSELTDANKYIEQLEQQVREFKEENNDLKLKIKSTMDIKFGEGERVIVSSTQKFLDLGLNGFAFRLMAESFLNKTKPDSKLTLVCSLLGCIFTIQRDQRPET
jgi:hypothetical protein